MLHPVNHSIAKRMFPTNRNELEPFRRPLTLDLSVSTLLAVKAKCASNWPLWINNRASQLINFLKAHAGAMRQT
jgi:hypothetical protein